MPLSVLNAEHYTNQFSSGGSVQFLNFVNASYRRKVIPKNVLCIAGPMVWYQKFEYAISHWLQKAAENIMGCVLCSPGCFSLFRGYALMDDNVMKRYTTPPTEARHYVQYDQGTCISFALNFHLLHFFYFAKHYVQNRKYLQALRYTLLFCYRNILS